MAIDALRSLTPDDVRSSMLAFKAEYVMDWDEWLGVPPDRKPELFGTILRRWQATRPYEMRRARSDAAHPPPHLDDFLERAAQPTAALTGLGLSWLNLRTPDQTKALEELWAVFSALALNGRTSCVGITKAVLLGTDGQIGPALDSQVRGRLRVRAPGTLSEWLDILDDVGADIRAFERLHGPLHRIVPSAFSKLGDGRLYDMAFGPKSSI